MDAMTLPNDDTLAPGLGRVSADVRIALLEGPELIGKAWVMTLGVVRLVRSGRWGCAKPFPWRMLISC